MQQFIDYIAILAFVAVYFVTKDIFLATAVLMGGVTLQIGIYWLIKKPIGSELKLTFWASMVLGGMTLIFQDETFIKWKPSIVNWLLAVVLVGAHLFMKTYLLGQHGAGRYDAHFPRRNVYQVETFNRQLASCRCFVIGKQTH